MFKKLNDFSYKRSFLEALGFYIVYTLLGMLIGGVSNLVLATILNLPMDNYQQGLETTKITGKYIVLIGGFYVSVINIVVAKSKNCLNKISSIFIILISFLLTWIFGAIIGLIPSAIMTTKDVSNEQ